MLGLCPLKCLIINVCDEDGLQVTQHKTKTKRPSPRHALRLGGFLRVFTSQPIRMRAPRSNINDKAAHPTHGEYIILLLYGMENMEKMLPVYHLLMYRALICIKLSVNMDDFTPKSR